MNKKIKNLFLAGALVVGLAGVAVSCTDYDDDINKLQTDVSGVKTDVTKLQGDVKALQDAINAGSVITKVEPKKAGEDTDLPNGGIVFTLSDGKVFKIANGAKGEQGEAGPAGPQGPAGKDADVWTIGADDFWYKNGVKTEYKAKGDKGEQGEQGETGDSEYYVPCTDKSNPAFGKFIKVHINGKTGEKTETTTDISVFPEGTLTAVWNPEDGTLTINNVEGVNGGVVVIPLYAKLASLVFIPQVYVDGVEGMDAAQFKYKPIEVGNEDSVDEVWNVVGGNNAEVTVNPGLIAEYHYNPSNARIDVKNLEMEFILRDEGSTPFVWTRGKAQDLVVTPEFISAEEGILKVKVNFEGKIATDEFISVVALKVKNGADSSVVSDYATIFENLVTNVRISDPEVEAKKKGLEDDLELYRASGFERGTNPSISEPDATAVPFDAIEAWTSLYDYNAIDTVLTAGNELNLPGIVALRDMGKNVELPGSFLEKFGLTWEFQIVKNYKLMGANFPAEGDFVEVGNNGTTLVVKEAYQYLAQGHTPIIRALLKCGNDVVKVAYIKVKLNAKQLVIAPPVDIDKEETNTFLFNCSDTVSFVQMTVDQMQDIYQGITSTDFWRFYSDSFPYPVSHVSSVMNPAELILQWQMNMKKVFENAGKNVNTEFLIKSFSYDSLYINVKFTAKVQEIAKELKLGYTTTDYIDEYWYGPERNQAEGWSFTQLNVNVPDVGETDPDKCQFANDLNAAFQQKDGKIWLVVKQPTGQLDTLSGTEFFFHKEKVEAIKKIGDHDVEFEVSADGLTLSLMKLDGKDVDPADQMIAQINNLGVDVPFNVVNYNKNSKAAKILLNTDAMYTFIGARSYFCGNAEYPVSILFQQADGTYEPYFRAEYIRPMYIKNTSPKSFTDGVDLGEAGSYIDLAELIDPTDWRGRSFNSTNPDYTNYWQYYGPITVTVATEDITCSLTPDKKLPATIKVEQVGTPWMGHDALTANGFLTYKNNGNVVSDFDLFVPITVNYGWGTIVTKPITVHVNKTIINP